MDIWPPGSVTYLGLYLKLFDKINIPIILNIHIWNQYKNIQYPYIEVSCNN